MNEYSKDFDVHIENDTNNLKYTNLLPILEKMKKRLYEDIDDINKVIEVIYKLQFDNDAEVIEKTFDSGQDGNNLPSNANFEAMIAKIDSDIAKFEQEKVEGIGIDHNIDEKINKLGELIGSVNEGNLKLSRLSRHEQLIPYGEINNEKELNFEQIGLDNYIDVKNMIQNVSLKSKDISRKIENRKNELLLSLEEGKSLSIRNSNLKKYKDFYNIKLADLEKKQIYYYEKIADIADLEMDVKDKKRIVQEELNGLLRYLSNLILDFSISKEAVKYYNVGRFYNNYIKMKTNLNIKSNSGELFNAFLESLLAFSYQASIARYEINYTNSDLVEKQRSEATMYMKNK